MIPAARRLLDRHLVWDNHGCMPMRADDSFLPELERYRAAGVDLVSLNIGFGHLGWDRHIEIVTHMRDWIARNPRHFGLVETVADIARLRAEGRLGVTFDVEGMAAIEDRPERVEQLYRLGVRWMLIAYNEDNDAGGGCLGANKGLTPLGRAIIDEMDRVGMILCLSHAGARTVREALDHVRHPPIFSHSNPKGFHEHPRNVPDDLIKACAERDGVFGLSGIGKFFGAGPDPVGRLVAQILYLIDLVGPRHIGLGLDVVFDLSELDQFVKDRPAQFAAGTETTAARVAIAPEDLVAIVDGMLKARLGEPDIAAILGGNWMRIARQVWT
jgi:membrane dipeptidase